MATLVNNLNDAQDLIVHHELVQPTGNISELNGIAFLAGLYSA